MRLASASLTPAWLRAADLAAASPMREPEVSWPPLWPPLKLSRSALMTAPLRASIS